MGPYDTELPKNSCGNFDPQITWNEGACILSWLSSQTGLETADLSVILQKAQDDLIWDPANCVLTYRDVNGTLHSSIDIGAAILDKIMFDLTSTLDLDTCQLTVTVGGSSTTVNLLGLLQQYGLLYSSQFHQLQPTIKGEPFGPAINLNCGEFKFNPVTCELYYKDEKGNVSTYFIPQDTFSYDAQSCLLVIQPAKGPTITVPTGVPISDVNLAMAPGDPCTLEFKYKGKVCQIPLPNSLIGCKYTLATNTLQMIHCDGAVKDINLPKATIECTTLDDGTQVLVFDNGCPGGQKIFNIPSIALDIDNLTVAGSVVTFTGGGDGNDQVVTFDICAIVATNCNSVITNVSAAGFEYTDNAGDSQFVPFPSNCCTYHDVSNVVIDPANPPTQPVGLSNKAIGDTAIVCHPNGTCYYTCVGNNWVLDFCKIIPDPPPEVWIGSTQPDKDDGYVVWFDPAACIVRFCDGEDGWREPRRVVCQPEEPPCEKGEADLWYNPTTCTFYICCEGVWVSLDGNVTQSVLQSLCIKIGNGPVQPITIDEDGKAIIPIPDNPDYCLVIGEDAPIFPSLTIVEGKLAFTLPEYPEFFETCLRIGGQNGDIIAPHLENGKYFLDYTPPAFPDIPDPIPPKCYELQVGGVPVTEGSNADGDIVWDITLPNPSSLVDNGVTNGVGSFTHNAGDGSDPVTVTFCKVCPVVTYGGNAVNTSTGPNGETIYDVPTPPPFPEIPALPEFCIQDKAGNPINGVYDAAANKVTLELPPILNCGTAEPAIDGSEGCLWFDPNTSCLFALCDGVWASANTQVSTN